MEKNIKNIADDATTLNESFAIAHQYEIVKKLTDAIYRLNDAWKENGLHADYYSDTFFYNMITDRESAKRLLIQNPNIWPFLSKGLRNDPEIIYYYQPMGIMKITQHDNYGNKLYVSNKKSNLLAQNHFGFMQGRGDLQLPGIDFPEDFDLEKYMQIQLALLANSIEINCSIATYDNVFDDFSDALSAYRETSLKGGNSTKSLLLFRRSLIKDFVEKYVKNGETR